jgi:sulfur transfer protein SufE
MADDEEAPRTVINDETPKAVTSGAPGGGSKVAMQMKKLKEANDKYKSLLKMAKERITTQEGELEALKGMNFTCLI